MKQVISKKVIADLCFIGLYGVAVAALFKKVKKELYALGMQRDYAAMLPPLHYTNSNDTHISYLAEVLERLADSRLDLKLLPETQAKFQNLCNEKHEFIDICKRLLTPCNTLEQTRQIFPKELYEMYPLEHLTFAEEYKNMPIGAIDEEARDKLKEVILESHLKGQVDFSTTNFALLRGALWP